MFCSTVLSTFFYLATCFCVSSHVLYIGLITSSHIVLKFIFYIHTVKFLYYYHYEINALRQFINSVDMKLKYTEYYISLLYILHLTI